MFVSRQAKEKLERVIRHINLAFKEAVTMAPSLVVLDNVDNLLPAVGPCSFAPALSLSPCPLGWWPGFFDSYRHPQVESGAQGGGVTGLRSTRLTDIVCDHLDSLRYDRTRTELSFLGSPCALFRFRYRHLPIGVLATAKNTTSFHADLQRGGSHHPSAVVPLLLL
jgi:hypothetical protein